MFWSILEVIAFVCIGSEFATVRALLPLHRRIGAYTALARAKNVGEASIARFATPTSRRRITEQGELSLPPERPGCFCDDHPKHLLGVDSTLQVESARRGEPVSCGVEGPLRWNPQARAHSGREADGPDNRSHTCRVRRCESSLCQTGASSSSPPRSLRGCGKTTKRLFP